jgi:4'-phosphopantetheinyl transferase
MRDLMSEKYLPISLFDNAASGEADGGRCDFPALHPDEVHLWRISTDADEHQLRFLKRQLAGDESERATRFRFDADRQRFITAHGMLRLLLGRYLKVAPQSLQFDKNEYGKPAVRPLSGNIGLQFNLSHSGSLALCAVTLRRDVGVDLEQMREDLADETVAARFFSQAENATLVSLPQIERTKAFFNCWTRKEAYVKAQGAGLTLPLDSFDVSLLPGAAAQLLAVHHDPQAITRWLMHTLEPASGYIGAVVAEGQNWNLKCWQAFLPPLPDQSLDIEV